MSKRVALFGSLLLVTLTAPAQRAPLGPEPPEPAAAKAHYARAREIAGKDPDLNKWIDQGVFCKSPQEHSRIGDAVPRNGHHDPVKMFDNLFMVGSTYVDSFILKTSAGLILWDTMNNSDDSQNIIEPGMRQLGLDPQDIKLIILTHGHADHWGGARYFQDKYHTSIAMAAGDWDWMNHSPKKPGGPEMPQHDRVLTDGQDITLGDTTVHIFLTPGHTPGVASSIFPVKDKGTPRMVAMLGGTSYNGADTQFKLSQMHESLHHLWEEVRKYHAVAYINTHAFVNLLDDKFARLGSAASNPLVIGEEGVDKSFAIQDECIEAMWAWYYAINRQ